jgi:DNA-binding winged helix-turn-helix (wHTH) protein
LPPDDSPAAGVFRFGDVELDVLAYTLRRRGRAVRLARQPMELLKLLVEQRGMLVTREQIAAHLWSDDVFVDVDAGIHTAVLKIRQALRDSSYAARYIETIPGKGYRFIAAVSVPSSDSIIRQPLHNLPADLTSFVGREKELDEVRALVMAERLVTLAGTGGCGQDTARRSPR